MPVQPGRIEEAVRDLQLTEPALLLRAAAIDEAARETCSPKQPPRHTTRVRVMNRQVRFGHVLHVVAGKSPVSSKYRTTIL